MSTLRPPFDVLLYRAALFLYPPAFRTEFAEEMREHVDSARSEAATAGRRALLRFHAETIRDFALTIAVQWLRSGWPIIALVAAIVPLALVSAIVGVVSRLSFQLPAERPDAELMSLVLLAVVSVLLIATTILLTVCFSPHLARRRR
ncbi:MAG TPA: hypothetical protein VFO19_14640 [Vicinamibacterales bacterium]|nr:hypothetical protein [Vicinamibacterales bacterium]